MMTNSLFLSVISLFFSFVPAAFGQDGNQEIISQKITGSILRPKQLKPTPALIRSLTLSPDFIISTFADNLGKSRMLAVSDEGFVYVTDRDNGTLTLLKDEDKDGRAEITNVVAKKEKLHGIAIDGRDMYLATVKEIYKTTIRPDGTVENLQRMVSDLPDGGQHGNRTIRIGQDGSLYVSIGSTCNSCAETNKEHATILKMGTDGMNRKVFASGLRNTVGFDWHPETGELWGFDHGIDWLGEDEQKEELNRIMEGEDYGWPYVYGDGKFEVHHDPKNMTHEAYAAKSVKPTLLYEAHAAPMALLFYTGDQFPGEYHGDAFVAMHGSWNKAEPSGYKVVRIKYTNGEPTEFEDFVTGFLTEDNGQFGRVCGLAEYTDGSLLISDDVNGIIYRVSYQN